MLHRVLYISALLLMVGFGVGDADIQHESPMAGTYGIGTQKRLSRNLNFNKWPAFVVMPGMDINNPDGIEKSEYTYFWDTLGSGVRSMFTLMTIQSCESEEPVLPLVSIRDEEYPIILLSGERTRVIVHRLPTYTQLEAPPSILIGLQILDKRGKWKESGKSKRKFYSYERDGEDFTITFDKNKSNGLRALKMEIGDRDIPDRQYTGTMPGPHRLTRTWIFVQLPDNGDYNIPDTLSLGNPSIFPTQKKFKIRPELIGDDGYSYDWVSYPEITMRNLQLNDRLAFLLLPMDECPIGPHLAPLEISDKQSLETIMILESIGSHFPYFSSQDMDHPIILISPFKTSMKVVAIPGNREPPLSMELASLKVPDEKGGWINATERECEFYSYDRDNSWFKLTFPENKTREFRCIAMTIRTVRKYSVNDGPPAPISRTWLFIQLPWTDNPAIFNHIPYTDFTVDQLQ